MTHDYARLIKRGAVVALVGFVTSGPLGFLTVSVVKPQPRWTSPEVFAENYHVIQDVPFYFGFLLIGGMLMLAAGHYLRCSDHHARQKFNLLLALGLTTAFVALITFNYICQTTFVRHLALQYEPAYDTAIATFSMTNPMSFCWANEMWGYGLLGVATWLTADYYKDKNNVIRWLLVANGVVSVGTVVAAVINVSWVMSPTGLAAYFLWNVLMIVVMAMIFRQAKRELKDHALIL